MKRCTALLFLLALLPAIALAACGEDQPTLTPVPTATATSEVTPAPTPESTPEQPCPTPDLPPPTTERATATVPAAKPGDGDGIEIARSEKPRTTSLDAAAPDLAELVAGNSAFAFDLYQTVRDEKDNFFYSPYSISIALAMTYAGARGETEQQMADTLHFALPQDRLHAAFNALDLTLASRGEGTGGFELNIANAIWGQEGYRFLAGFLDVLAENYGVGLRLLDFWNAPEESRVVINDWVSDHTEGRIEDLILPGLISEETVLILTNAIYFNAKWHQPFERRLTRDGTFHLLDGSEVMVPMMGQTEHLVYAEGEGYQAVELPYRGLELSMVILLPEEGHFEAFDSGLTAERVNGIVEDLARREVALTMPKFAFESGFSLREALSAMGMPVAFSVVEADFSGMTGDRGLFIGSVVHKAFVSVDEAGTEAAAATAVIMVESAPSPGITEVTVDRPFIFLIRDIETGAILFLGRVLDPSA